MTKQNDNSEQLIAALERTIQREKSARKQAEQQLEQYSRDIYQSNILLKEQTVQAQKKQKNLSFLTSIAENGWRCPSVSELINNYLQKCGSFVSRCATVFFQIENDMSLSRLQISNSEQIVIELPELNFDVEFLQELMLKIDLEKLKHDFFNVSKGKIFQLSDYKKIDLVLENDFHVYLLPIYSSKGKELNKMGCMCFFYNSPNDIDLTKLQTIEASHSIFSVAIEQKKAEAVLKRKIAELQQTNQELQQTEQQLVESEKLASLGQLSAGIAHEINNPIGFVLSNLSTMTEYMTDLHQAISPITKEASPSAETVKKWQSDIDTYEVPYLLEDGEAILKSSVDGLQRVKNIVADLSSFARMDSNELNTVSVDQVITSALNIVHNELKYQHTVLTELNPNSLILGNEGQLQQVFINLFMNAKQAMPDGGEIFVSCKKVKERILVTVKDQGCGIESKHQKEIFTPFFTTKPPGQGTGLGLSISYSILQRHHAKVRLNSELGKGTEFVLSFVAAH